MDKSRQQFEEWRSKNKSSTINLFDVWQASRESLEVELPTKEPNPSQNNSYAFGYNRAITEATELLNRQGVKIKNENTFFKR
ncbi:hypothetical protein I9Y56_001136 [Providencia stuartii]